MSRSGGGRPSFRHGRLLVGHQQAHFAVVEMYVTMGGAGSWRPAGTE